MSQTNISKDEAALYDRQIRLWGFGAQQRMRQTTICVLGLGSLATEVLKNIVLAGLGRVILVDQRQVEEKDLGSGFLWSEASIGRPRAQAMLPNLTALNPHVQLSVLERTLVQSTPRASTPRMTMDEFEEYLKTEKVDLLFASCQTGQTYQSLNDVTRRLGIAFMAADALGFGGWAFTDSISMEYTTNKEGTQTATRDFVPLAKALEHTWKAPTTSRQLKRAHKEAGRFLLDIWALWRYQAKHDGRSPSSESADSTEEYKSMCRSLARDVGLSEDIYPEGHLESMPTFIQHTLSPSAAILGGILAQDILNTVGARKRPIANWLSFDGSGRSYTDDDPSDDPSARERDGYPGIGGIWQLSL